MTSIDRVKKPSDYPDYQPTHSDEGSIPSTLVVRCGCMSLLCHEMVKARRDPTMFKSWSLRTGHLFRIIAGREEILVVSIILLCLACCSWNRNRKQDALDSMRDKASKCVLLRM